MKTLLKLLMLSSALMTLSQADEMSQAQKFSKLIDAFIQQKVNAIKKPPTAKELIKGEFETTKAFNARVKVEKAKSQKAIRAYQQKVQKVYRTYTPQATQKALQYLWGKPQIQDLRYDADNGFFVAQLSFSQKSDFDQKVAIKVPLKYAKKFKQNAHKLKPQAIFDFDGKSVSLKRIQIPYAKKSYIAQFTDMDISDTKIAVNIQNEIQTAPSVAMDITVKGSQIASLDTSKLKNFSELDTLLKSAKASKKDAKKWLLVIGIEQYEFTDNISYANRSAKMFAKVADKMLGVPKSQQYILIDKGASQAKIKTAIKKMLRRVKKWDTVYFYYNGHGVPIPSQKNEPFILATDTEPDFIGDETFFSLSNLYKKLSDPKVGKVVAIVDSCFSGVTDGKGVLKGVAATKLVAKKVGFDKKRMVVLTAGKANQYSNAYNQKGHRLFSFFVMKNMIANLSEGKADIKSLYRNTKSQTYNASIKEYGDLRTQEPSIEGNYRLKL